MCFSNLKTCPSTYHAILPPWWVRVAPGSFFVKSRPGSLQISQNLLASKLPFPFQHLRTKIRRSAMQNKVGSDGVMREGKEVGRSQAASSSGDTLHLVNGRQTYLMVAHLSLMEPSAKPQVTWATFQYSVGHYGLFAGLTWSTRPAVLLPNPQPQ